jgi:hypothetical protein
MKRPLPNPAERPAKQRAVLFLIPVSPTRWHRAGN